jgi:L-amino acid N-acyltransferase YncA
MPALGPEMKFTVRKAQIADANDIGFVQVDSWRTTYAGIVPDEYLASLSAISRADRWKEQFHDETTLIFVAQDETGVFGFASGGKLRDPIEGYDAELYAIYLLQDKQRRGAGKILCQKLAEALRMKDFRSLIVWVLAKNPSAGFYAHLGGIPVDEKQIDIGGVQLTETAFGWASLDSLAESTRG